MEINYLKDYVMLAQTCHFQEAADLLFISQSTLSKHIKSIELELGQELFIRSRKRTELTAFGKEFLPYAKKILAIQEEYTDLLLPDNSTGERVAFGGAPMVTLYNFMRFFTEFLKKRPNFQYSIIQGSSQRLLSLLQHKHVDFILTDDIPLPDDEYQKVLYTRDWLVVVIPQNHPLAACDNVNVKDLEKENLITFTNNPNTEHYLRRLYPGYDFQMPISVEKETLLFNLIRQGFGISVMTNWSSRHYSAEGTVIKEIYPRSYLDIYMIYQKNRKLSPLTRAFSDFLNKRNEKVPALRDSKPLS